MGAVIVADTVFSVLCDERLLRWKLICLSHIMSNSSRTNWILAVAAICGAFALPPPSRESPRVRVAVERHEDEPFTISGSVVDPLASPVAHARVWLHAQARLRHPERIVLAQAETDDAGAFTLVTSSQSLARSIDLRAAAVGGDGRIGWWEQFAGQVPQRLALRLQGVTSFSGQVSSSASHPLAGIRIVPRTAEIDEDGIEHFHHLPPELSERLTATTDASGKFTIPSVPEVSSLLFDLDVKVTGRVSCRAQTSQPVSIRIPELGRFSGRFFWADSTRQERFQPAEVELFEECCFDTPEPGQALLSFMSHTRIQADGSFEFRRVPVGEYLVQVTPGEGQFVSPKAFRVVVTDQVLFTHVAIPVRPNREAAKPVGSPARNSLRSVFDPLATK